MALPGFTYGMPEYGCRAYWKCIDGFSVGHCCSEDSAYVEGMGCLEDIPCFDKCPPEGGIAVRRKYLSGQFIYCSVEWCSFKQPNTKTL